MTAAGTHKVCAQCGDERRLRYFPLVQPENPLNCDRSDTCNRCDQNAYARADNLASRDAKHILEKVQRDLNWLPPVEQQRTNSRKRLKRLKQAQPPWANTGKILSIYREAKRLTRETGILHQVDHIIPIKGKFVSGLHVEANLQIITAEANRKKYNSYSE